MTTDSDRTSMPSHSSTAPNAQRQLVLQGESAAAWLSQRGFEPESSHGLRLHADEFMVPGFRLARVWHTETSLTITPPAESTLVMVQMEGDIDVRAHPRGAPGSTARGDTVAISGGSPVAIPTVKGGRYEADIRLDHLPKGVVAAVVTGAVLHSSTSAFRSMFVSSANAALNSSMTPTDRSFPVFQSTIRTVLTGLLLDGLGNEISAHKSLGALYHRAYEVILMNAADPNFSAAELPGQLRVSSSYLRRAFAAHGATSAGTIRHVRAATARDYMAYGDRSLSRDDVARLSGFRSIRAMNEAVRSSQSGRSASAELLVRSDPGGAPGVTC